MKTKHNVQNLFTFVFICVACSTVYYMINFYVKYLPGDIYLNQVFSSLSETVANVITLYFTRIYSIKKGLMTSFLVTTIGCVLVICSQLTGWDFVIPFAVLQVKAGMTIAFGYFFFATVHFFRTEFLGLVMGTANVIGRMSTILAPVIAEMEHPIPMIFSIALCGLAIAFVDTLT
jgi:hypothetical protein